MRQRPMAAPRPVGPATTLLMETHHSPARVRPPTTRLRFWPGDPTRRAQQQTQMAGGPRRRRLKCDAVAPSCHSKTAPTRHLPVTGQEAQRPAREDLVEGDHSSCSHLMSGSHTLSVRIDCSTQPPQTTACRCHVPESRTHSHTPTPSGHATAALPPALTRIPVVRHGHLRHRRRPWLQRYPEAAA